MLTAAELQSKLRMVEVLSGCEVEPVSVLTPWDVFLTGLIHIHGRPSFYEVRLDLRDFRDNNDVLKLMDGLMKAFTEAATSGDAKRTLQ